VIAAIDEELIAGRRDDRDGCLDVKIEERQCPTGLDLQLAILGSDMKFSACA
jgi:hypothetical protein